MRSGSFLPQARCGKAIMHPYTCLVHRKQLKGVQLCLFTKPKRRLVRCKTSKEKTNTTTNQQRGASWRSYSEPLWTGQQRRLQQDGRRFSDRRQRGALQPQRSSSSAGLQDVSQFRITGRHAAADLDLNLTLFFSSLFIQLSYM